MVGRVMTAPGETDLAKMLATLRAERRPGVFTMVTTTQNQPELARLGHAMIVEYGSPTAPSEHVERTYVVAVDEARALGLEVVTEMAWLSLTVNSSLDAVGLTAAFSAMLTEHGISCNVLAGYHHDHLLVPVERADEALDVLNGAEPNR